MLRGFGNNGEDGTEGARYKNVFGTYSHGPVLPKNPAFADALRKARDAGVALYAFDCAVTPDSMSLDAPVPILL